MEWLRTLVRPIVTFAITAIFGYGLVKALIPWEAGLPVITMVFVFWFEGKAVERIIGKLKSEETVYKIAIPKTKTERKQDKGHLEDPESRKHVT